jgi:hypothetical protein
MHYRLKMVSVIVFLDIHHPVFICMYINYGHISFFSVLPSRLCSHARVVSSSQHKRHGAETEDLDMFRALNYPPHRLDAGPSLGPDINVLGLCHLQG